MAIALILAPPGTPEQAADGEANTALRSALQTVALEWEILDPRETRYVLIRAEDFQADLDLLRRRFEDLNDAPPLADCDRFPERQVVNELLSFNRNYRQFVDTYPSLQMAVWWQLRHTVQETDQLHQVWDAIRDARCEYYYVGVRRQALKRLRELLGDEAYYKGELPPYVPLWRFQMFN